VIYYSYEAAWCNTTVKYNRFTSKCEK